MRSRLFSALLILAVATACGNEPTDSVAEATLTVEGAPSQADTVGTRFAVPFVIRIARGGRAVTGVEVRFEGTSERDIYGDEALRLSNAVDSPNWSFGRRTHTDSGGRAGTFIRAGYLAGTFPVRVMAPDLGLSAEVQVTVRPGKPVRIEFWPGRDTAVHAGVTFALAARAVDFWGNVAPGPTPVAISRPHVAEWLGDDRVRALAHGRAHLVATYGALRDSAGISVVPPGRLLAQRFISSSEPHALVLLDTDGHALRDLPQTEWANNGLTQYFLPGGDRIVFADVQTVSSSLFIADTSGARHVLLAPNDSIERMLYPQPTRDGAWIYFTAATRVGTSELWRVRPDGRGASRVRPPGAQWTQYGPMSPSPAGTHAALIRSYQDGPGGTTLDVLDIVSGELRTLRRDASRARWSPVADEIATFAAGLRVVRSDGTEVIAAAVPGQPPFQSFDATDGHVDWSPDGKWLVACVRGSHAGERYLTLVSRESGELVPLEFTRRHNLCGAAWRPT